MRIKNLIIERYWYRFIKVQVLVKTGTYSWHRTKCINKWDKL